MENNKKRGNLGRNIFVSLVVAILLVAIASVAFVLATEGVHQFKRDSSKIEAIDKDAALKTGESKEYNEKNTDGTLTSVEVAEKVKPSVVAVVTYNGNSVYGEGSGVVMSKTNDGFTYIITCAHIVSTKGVTAVIELEDGTQFNATVIGYDSRTDIAVLRIKTTKLKVAEFGDSSVLKVGEPIYAVGNPGGTAFYGSFTGGYVSAIDRPTTTSSSAYSMECIQHDAAINPGNSGGALVNSFGQVVGINSSKIAAEEYEGMGFAIPISVAKEIVDDILANGYVVNRAKLGIQYLPANQNQTYNMIVKMKNLPAGSIIIAEIDKDGALAGTDAVAGDLIVAVNGKSLDKVEVLLKVIEKSNVGDKLKLSIVHINDDYSIEEFEITVTLVEDRGFQREQRENENNFKNPFSP
ncbi:MAG: serine protease [Ruminococcaceae bacterium]|nr:serine protease [Oscillospiraceae bacterium]